jgi:hypothetical protein
LDWNKDSRRGNNTTQEVYGNNCIYGFTVIGFGPKIVLKEVTK